MKPILVADNDPTWLHNLSDIIQNAGYDVIPAKNYKEAMAIIGNHDAELAVVDLRLEEDEDKSDISGLHVAEDTDRTVPKIIVSGFSNIKDAAEHLKLDLEGFPTILDFVEKTQVSRRLIPSIQRAIKLKKTLLSVAQGKVTSQLNKDYDHARSDAKMHFWSSLILSAVFVIPIVWGVFMLHTHPSISVLFAIVGVVVAQITHHLFNSNLKFLYGRVDRFHAELLEANRFEQLLDATSQFDDRQKREEYKLSLLQSAAARWLIGDGARREISEGEDNKSQNVDSSVM